MSYDAKCCAGFFRTKDEPSLLKVVEHLKEECDIAAVKGSDTTISDCRGYGSYHDCNFSPLADLVETGFLDFIGEDYAIWSLVFNEGEMTDVGGGITWRHQSEAAITSSPSDEAREFILGTLIRELEGAAGLSFERDVFGDIKCTEEEGKSTLYLGSDTGSFELSVGVTENV